MTIEIKTQTFKQMPTPFISSYGIFKTHEGKYRIDFVGDVINSPPSYAYWLGQGKFLQTATFTTSRIAQLFRHNHLDMTDRRALGYIAFPDTGVIDYGVVEPK